MNGDQLEELFMEGFDHASHCKGNFNAKQNPYLPNTVEYAEFEDGFVAWRAMFPDEAIPNVRED